MTTDSAVKRAGRRRRRLGSSLAMAAALSLGVSGLTGCEIVEEGNFSLLSYNVAGLPQEISGQNPSVNIPLISPKLEPYDIVVTQEDFDWWAPELDPFDFVNYHTRLRADTTHAYQSNIHPGPAAVGIDGSDPERPLPYVGDGLGMLSRYAMQEPTRVPWEHCFGGADTSDGGAADCLAMKGFSVSTVTFAPGVLVDVYNLHGEAGRTVTDTRMLGENYELLASYINQHSAGRAVIVAGDSNLHTESGHVMQPSHGPIWTKFLADAKMTDACSATTCQHPGAIDKVAFKAGGGVTLQPLLLEWKDDVFVDGNGNDLSDHPPVAVEWKWARWEQVAAH